MIILFTTKTSRLTSTSRIQPIDMLRGLLLILMTVESVKGAPPAHLCEVPFIFLAGTSAWFIQGRKTMRETAFFLLQRGAWLVLLQLSIVSFSHSFNFDLHTASFGPLSTIGFSMMALAGLIYFPFYWMVGAGLLLTLAPYIIGGTPPMLENIGIMSLGFCFGSLYTGEMDVRKRRWLLFTLDGKVVRFLLILGRVPLFYYLLHIYLVPLLIWMLGPIASWAIALITISLLYPCCYAYDRYKQHHRKKWWLHYL